MHRKMSKKIHLRIRSGVTLLKCTCFLEGIGENALEISSRICERLMYLVIESNKEKKVKMNGRYRLIRIK